MPQTAYRPACDCVMEVWEVSRHNYVFELAMNSPELQIFQQRGKYCHVPGSPYMCIRDDVWNATLDRLRQGVRMRYNQAKGQRTKYVTRYWPGDFRVRHIVIAKEESRLLIRVLERLRSCQRIDKEKLGEFNVDAAVARSSECLRA